MIKQLGALTDVIDHYRERGVVRAVDGGQPVQVVGDTLLAELGPLARKGT